MCLRVGDEHKLPGMITSTNGLERGHLCIFSFQCTPQRILPKSKEKLRDLDVTVVILAAVKEVYVFVSHQEDMTGQRSTETHWLCVCVCAQQK